MIWSMASSLLIHNTGLGVAVLFSFLWVLLGMTIAWFLIVLHQQKMTKQATLNVQETIKQTGLNGDLAEAIQQEKKHIAASKTFAQRMFSYKAVHGMLMFTSWFNIVGRIFASNQSGDFTCYTYPVYKPIDTKHFNGTSYPMTPVPALDPDYARLPWAKMGNEVWAVLLLFGPLAAAAIVGAVWSLVASRRRTHVISSTTQDTLVKAVLTQGATQGGP
jgi:hypothetical protein